MLFTLRLLQPLAVIVSLPRQDGPQERFTAPGALS